MKKLVLLILATLILIGVINNYEEDYYIIPDKSIIYWSLSKEFTLLFMT